MPVYEYVCEACRHEFEELARSMAADGPKACPKCGGSPVARRLSPFSARRTSDRQDQGSQGMGCGRCGAPDGPCGL